MIGVSSMTEDDLKRQHWQYLGTVGIVRDHAPRLYVVGINGANDFLIGLAINGNTVQRLPCESYDELVSRVRCDPALRGDDVNMATCLYTPHVEPKSVRQTQPRFQHDHPRGA